MECDDDLKSVAGVVVRAVSDKLNRDDGEGWMRRNPIVAGDGTHDKGGWFVHVPVDWHECASGQAVMLARGFASNNVLQCIEWVGGGSAQQWRTVSLTDPRECVFGAGGAVDKWYYATVAGRACAFFPVCCVRDLPCHDVLCDWACRARDDDPHRSDVVVRHGALVYGSLWRDSVLLPHRYILIQSAVPRPTNCTTYLGPSAQHPLFFIQLVLSKEFSE